MKKVTIRKFTHAEINMPAIHETLMAEGEEMEVSDGYHTFAELYDHRIALYIALCAVQRLFTDKEVWRSKAHSDGSSYEGWFILGIHSRAGDQITYHLPMSRWDDTNFAVTMENAPEFDGHTPADVISRINNL